ncbi:MAG: hypothetical protein G01um101477_301 [Candidatus Doudnabacteria bacterium Gr01-1014_77]|uniref:Maf-like protein n=1 Tax=Candidatus Doudnabacteria bacterium Gr01-1014_77 TaxID=2017133 RepID=A0A554JC42_9BACT|nr:MAG: hypothetical protein G01um101477_301 [Candidatus Doudnabacteria bacterium Gr01-1014_77]
MTITLCGSIAFIDQMYELKGKLEALGFNVLLPPDKVPNTEGELVDAKDYYASKKKAMSENNHAWVTEGNLDHRIKAHFEKIAKGDSILIANYDKNGIKNYVGPNSLVEMGIAFYLNKKIYLLNPVPDIAYKEEILGMKPEVIENDLKRIK